MRTKANYIDAIRDMLKKVSQTSLVDHRSIEMNANFVWEQLLNDLSMKDITYKDFYCKEYKNVAVIEDADRELYYSLLPAPIVQLEDYSEGIRNISTMTGLDFDFVPTSEDEISLINGLEVDLVDTNIPYIVRWDRIYYYKNIPQDIIDAGVRMLLVVPFTEYLMTDNLPIPGGKAMDFVTMVVKYMSAQSPMDLNNKNES